MSNKRIDRIQQLVADVDSLGRAGRLEDAQQAGWEADRELNKLGPGAAQARARNLSMLGALFRESCEIEQADALFVRALKLAPPGPFRDVLRVRKAFLVAPMIVSRKAIAETRARFAREMEALVAKAPSIADPLADIPTLHFFLAYHGEDDRPLMELQGRAVKACCPSLFWESPQVKAPRSPRKPRLGFFSTYFKDHTIGRLNEATLLRLPRESFEKVLFLVAGDTDRFSEKLVPAMDRVVPLPRNVRAARERIAAEDLDVLYFADIGMDTLSYFLACSRLARFQLSTWGHPITSGLPAMDGFLIGDEMEPAGGESHFTERLLRMRLPNVVYPRPVLPEHPKGREGFGLPPSGAIYLCPQAPFKLHPDFDLALADLLRRDPEGRVVMLEPKYGAWKQILLDRWKPLMKGDVERVVFLPTMPRDDFLSLLALGDVMLDPFPYGGGNTTLEALALGTPVVTLPIEHVRGRLSLAFLRRAGISTGIVASAEEYAKLACDLAHDVALRERVRAEVREKCGVLFDDAGPIEEMAALLLREHEGR